MKMMFWFCTFMTLILILMSTNLNMKMKNKSQKAFMFECGFNNIMNKKEKFSNQFFLISILFLIFDLEMIFIIPSIMLKSNFSMNYMLIPMFITSITLILIMEWKQGMVEWTK